MIIDLTSSPSGSFTFDYSDGVRNYEGILAEVITPIIIRGDYNIAGDSVIVSGTINYDVKYPCSRCLEPVVEHYKISFDEVYMDDSEAEFKVIDEKIDLSSMVDENIVLNIPYRVLCKENCKGLCPVCGINLNKKKCKCNTSIDDISGANPFAVLKDFTTGGAEDGITKKKDF